MKPRFARKRRAGLSGGRKVMMPTILVPLLAALVISGCQSMPPQSRNAGKGEDGKVFVLVHGIDQIRDADSGDAFHVICAACAKSTIKTRYRPPLPVALSMAPVVPVPANPISVLVQETVPAPAPTPDTGPAGQPAEFKHLVPFAFGRSSLGPQGRDAMDAILAVAKEAKHIHVRGYTDIIGAMSINKRLAMARAAEIRSHLIKMGVTPDRISTSYCIDCFSDSNETDAGRAANRCAVVILRPGSDFSLEAGYTREEVEGTHRPIGPTQHLINGPIDFARSGASVPVLLPQWNQT